MNKGNCDSCRHSANGLLDSGVDPCKPCLVAPRDVQGRRIGWESRDEPATLPEIVAQPIAASSPMPISQASDAAIRTLRTMGYKYRDHDLVWTPPIDKAPATCAPDLLDAAAGHMRDRAATYDKPEGERSMGKTVQAFNIITGRDLSESEGWLLMQLLKDVRDRQRAEPHRDSLEDCIAYSALKAEARLGGK